MRVQEVEKLSLEQIRAFLDASVEMRFEGQNRSAIYAWVNTTLRPHDYERLGRSAKGLLRRFVRKMTGDSRAQLTRLITPYQSGSEVRLKPYRRRRFPTRFTRADIELLAAVEEVPETLSGPATQKLLQRAGYDFGDQRYQRLASISVAHL